MKYRKRGKHFSAYKFYRAQLDRMLLMWHQKATSEQSLNRLGILEYQFLDMLEESQYIKRYLYPKSEHAMDGLYLELLRTVLDEARPGLESHQEEALRTILQFLCDEASYSQPEKT